VLKFVSIFIIRVKSVYEEKRVAVKRAKEKNVVYYGRVVCKEITPP